MPDFNKDVTIEEVIITRLTRRGNGKDTPIRIITEIWSKNGDKIAETDPCPEYIGKDKKINNSKFNPHRDY